MIHLSLNSFVRLAFRSWFILGTIIQGEACKFAACHAWQTHACRLKALRWISSRDENAMGFRGKRRDGTNCQAWHAAWLINLEPYKGRYFGRSAPAIDLATPLGRLSRWVGGAIPIFRSTSRINLSPLIASRSTNQRPRAAPLVGRRVPVTVGDRYRKAGS